MTFSSSAFPDFLDVSVGDLDSLELPDGWTRYPYGVLSLILRRGYVLRGADLLIASDVPTGAGLSSSAALEVGIATALDQLFGLNLTPVEIAKIGQQTENDFAGVNTGIMDQMASVLGKAGHAVLLDCRSLESQQIPLSNASFLICDTRTKHSLAESEYNTRRMECESAAAALGERSLRDAGLSELGVLPDQLLKRARHVVSENLRVEAAVDALRSGDLEAVGWVMNDSHASLRDDFEVSSPELDIMSDTCRSQPEILGSRMTGGGFGGCTVSLAHAGSDLEGASNRIAHEYVRLTGIEPAIYQCHPADGAHEIIGLTN